MKKQLVLFVVLLASFLSPAMAQKGTWLWYGNLGGHNASSDATIVNGEKWAINTVEGIGYQLARHWHVGLQGSLGYAKSEVFNTSGGINDIKNSNWSAGIFVRYTVGKRVYAFAQYDMGWAQSKQKINDVEIGHSHGFGIGITPTVGVNVYRGWCLNLSFANISWNSTNPTNSTGSNANTTDFVYNIGQTFTFGISKIFGHGANDGVCKLERKKKEAEESGK